MPFLLPRSPISDSPFFFFFTTFYLINLSFSSFFRHFRAFLFLTHNVLLSLIIVTTTYPSDFHSSVIDRLFLSLSSISCILLHQLLYISSRQFSSPRQSSCRFALLPVFFLFFLQEPAKFTFFILSFYRSVVLPSSLFSRFFVLLCLSIALFFRVPPSSCFLGHHPTSLHSFLFSFYLSVSIPSSSLLLLPFSSAACLLLFSGFLLSHLSLR